MLSFFKIKVNVHTIFCRTYCSSKKIGYVYVGGESFDNSIQVSYNKVIIHEKFQMLSVFTESGMYNLPVHDIALIRLASTLMFSEKVRPIDLPMSPMTDPNVEFVGRGEDEVTNTYF